MKGHVCVIGCNGYVGSNVVKELLEQGYSVRGTVRGAIDETMAWLEPFAIPRATDGAELALFNADPNDVSSIEAVMRGCMGVINCAGTIVQVPETVEAMRTIAANVCDAALRADVSPVILTSSTGSTNPKEGEPALKNEEEHWSDVEFQLSKNKYAAAAKTTYDRTIMDKMDASDGKLRCVTIHPSMIVGPNHRPDGENSLKLFLRLMAGDLFPKGPPNGSMSAIHVQDLARMHVAALENPDARGRYFGLKKSWHWKDIFETYATLVKGFEPPAYADDVDLVTPTQFDFTRRDSLGVELRDLPDILQAGVDELKRRELI